jgi:RNA polymerase sigma-70 factor (ECF subfamily)
MSDTPSGQTTRRSLLVRLRDLQDAESWRAFVDLYAPLIFRYCRRQGLQEADAADVGQEVLAQVARSIRTFEYRPEQGRFRDWLGAVTRSRLSRAVGRRGPQARGTAGDDAPDWLSEMGTAAADPEWTSAFNNHVLQAALAQARPHFEEATWRAFELVWLHDRSAAAAADELGVPIAAVYVAKSRVLKALRAEVLALAEDVPHLVPLH